MTRKQVNRTTANLHAQTAIVCARNGQVERAEANAKLAVSFARMGGLIKKDTGCTGWHGYACTPDDRTP